MKLVQFQVVGFLEEEVQIIYKMLAAILHLGDIEFGEAIDENNGDNKATIIDTAPLHRGYYQYQKLILHFAVQWQSFDFC